MQETDEDERHGAVDQVDLMEHKALPCLTQSLGHLFDYWDISRLLELQIQQLICNSLISRLQIC